MGERERCIFFSFQLCVRVLRGCVALQALDVEGDWDPEEYDRQMAAVLQEVEGEDVGEGIMDDEKPTWDDDIDIGDIPLDDENEAGPSSSALNNRERRKNKKKEKKEKKRKRDAEEDDGVDVEMMDADAEPVVGEDGEEEWDGTEEMRKKVLDKYMEDVYGMEFNDVVRPSLVHVKLPV